MTLTELHSQLLSSSFEEVLGRANKGSMAFVRCLTPDVVEALANDSTFSPEGWRVWRVADTEDTVSRTLKADHAVEIRESKGEPVLLLVDTMLAGAGMDGIYSAAQEVEETKLFGQGQRLALSELTKRRSRATRSNADLAIKKARGYGQRFSNSPWAVFDFFVRIAEEQRNPGDLLYLLGLWPIQQDTEIDFDGGALDASRRVVDRLFGMSVAGLSPTQRINGLNLASKEQITQLEGFLQRAATKPLLPALADLADKNHLWINELQFEESGDIHGIEIVPWRTKLGRIARWSGLIEETDPEDPPVFVLNSEAAINGDYSKLEIHWNARPDNLAGGAVDYRVVILTDMEEELASREVTHAGKREEKCWFTNEDFTMLPDDALIGAKIFVSVIGNDQVEIQESEEFTIRFGNPSINPPVGMGKKLRTFSEGLIELADRDRVSEIASSVTKLPIDAKDFVLLRTPDHRSFKVFRPPLIRDVEAQWVGQSDSIGRWRVKVRVSGSRVGQPEFVPFPAPKYSESMWTRTNAASKRMAARFAIFSGVGQIYDENSKDFDSVTKEYLLAWAALLEEGNPGLALANTVEIQSLSGRTIGLIVLPSHPLRVAWHAAYDNLVLHAAFEEGAAPKEIRDEFSVLDGSMFPTFLPGLDDGSPFVFSDTLGFHAVAMVLDHDKEPKAAVAIMSRALGESETADATPTLGRQSGQVLGNEITKYIDSHDDSKILHIHALRPGDGLTVARSLGHVVHQSNRRIGFDEDPFETDGNAAPAFVLELYPSMEQRGIAGRFIAEAREKRRSGAGVLAVEDRWMLESIRMPGGINLPRLRWARKSEQAPQTAAHIAVAFDTFESQVVCTPDIPNTRPVFVYGLMSFLERHYTNAPSPLWISTPLAPSDGEKHPSDRAHTDRLIRLQQIIGRCVARSMGTDISSPRLRTEITAEKADGLRELHGLCDWVMTVDRNSGIDYFDSPRDNKDVYDAYVIDCVPEREDMGSLQLITSTSNFEEVRKLLDAALDQMGLSRSRRNGEFLLERLKALSGRLAMRLTNQKPTSELIALALSQANCRLAPEQDNCWTSLDAGFLIPVDDILDLIPPLNRGETDGDEPLSDSPIGKVRPDLIHVSVVPRRGLSFRFVEVKHRRHLRAARSIDVLEHIQNQTRSLRKRWNDWYWKESNPASLRAVRRAKLARVLRFYADKAHRHYLAEDRYEVIVAEIDRMVERGGNYSFADGAEADRGWVFCPEYEGFTPEEISPPGWDTRIFLFGPGLLPNSEFRQETIIVPFDDVGDDLTVSTETVADSHSNERFEGSQSRSQTEIENGISLANHIGLSPSGIDIDDDERHVSLGTDSFTGSEIRWPLTVKGNPHLLVAGLPGMGKTTLLLNLCKQMLEVDVRPIVFSYHQDIDERLQDLVPSVRFVDFNGLGFNPLRVIDRQSRLAYLDVAGALRDIFVSIYPELGDIQGERIRKAIKDSFIENGWDDDNQDLSKLTEPHFGRFVEILRSDPKPDRGLRTLLGRIDELQDYGFFDVAGPEESMWESDEPIVIRIHATQNDHLQRAFASMVFYGLYKDMFRRGIQHRITHAVIFDEAHRAARLKLIPTMAKECRKYGISLVLASQEAKDFNVSLFSAIANYLVLKLNEVDAKAFVRNVASSNQERALVDKLKQLNRFKALYFCEGQKNPSAVSLSP
ncbi:MAG: hypothetical protein O2960_22325 [Verrucomicrobia bacterium]|nr:hypothetical protein [Verrucomicrobiota bacterium]